MSLDAIFILRLILASLTCFRLAQLITLDKGPLLIFERFRLWVEQNAAMHPISYWWRSLADGVSCPYCMGFYLSLLCTLLVVLPSQAGDLFLLWFGIMGTQALLQGVSNRE